MNKLEPIFIGADGFGDFRLIQSMLRVEFENVTGATGTTPSVAAFEKIKPKVMVLAFGALDVAQQYYLDLYRHSDLIQDWPHKTIVLCNKDELKAAYHLCRKRQFDDYVLFWPMAQDAHRLPMAVHQALRQLESEVPISPTAEELTAQAQQLARADTALGACAARGVVQARAATHAVGQARQGIRAALDHFSHRLSSSRLADAGDVARLQGDFERMKSSEVDAHLENIASQVAPVQAWADGLQDNIARELAAVHSFQIEAIGFRPLVLMVDGSEPQHQKLRELLQDENLDLAFETSGAQSLLALAKCHPDLVLMDVDLPDIDGIKATRRIKEIERFSHVPVLMIGERIDKGRVVAGIDAGAAGFIMKPFRKDVLLAKIVHWVRKDRT